MIERHGVFWIQAVSGFWQPTHWLARCHKTVASPPSGFCWGFRCLTHGASAQNDPALPVHLLRNVPGYDAGALGSKRSNQLRSCRKRVHIAQLLDSKILEEQGYEIVCSARRRTCYGNVPTHAAYVDGVRRLMSNYPGIVLGGFIDGRLGGYLYGKIIGQTAYIDAILIATEALRSNIGTGLVFDFVQLCRATSVSEIVYGLHYPEDPKLTAFKEGMLFPVVDLPMVSWIFAPMRIALRMLRPNVLYRLTGCSSKRSSVNRFKHTEVAGELR